MTYRGRGAARRAAREQARLNEIASVVDKERKAAAERLKRDRDARPYRVPVEMGDDVETRVDHFSGEMQRIVHLGKPPERLEVALYVPVGIHGSRIVRFVARPWRLAIDGQRRIAALDE